MFIVLNTRKWNHSWHASVTVSENFDQSGSDLSNVVIRLM